MDPILVSAASGLRSRTESLDMLANNIANHKGEDFLAVTMNGLVDLMQLDFAELTPLATIATSSGHGGGRAYTVYIARGFRGDGHRQR